MPLQANARLTKIIGQGTPADWDVGGVAGAEKWSGVADAYYTEKRERVQAGQATDVLLRRSLIVDTPVAELLDNDDTITFTYRGTERTAKVQLIEHRDLEGMPAELRTSRLTLEDA